MIANAYACVCMLMFSMFVSALEAISNDEVKPKQLVKQILLLSNFFIQHLSLILAMYVYRCGHESFL